MTEQEYAIMEGKQNDSCERYFFARPDIDTPVNRKIFQDGFYRAYRLFADQENK